MRDVERKRENEKDESRRELSQLVSPSMATFFLRQPKAGGRHRRDWNFKPELIVVVARRNTAAGDGARRTAARGEPSYCSARRRREWAARFATLAGAAMNWHGDGAEARRCGDVVGGGAGCEL